MNVLQEIGPKYILKKREKTLRLSRGGVAVPPSLGVVVTLDIDGAEQRYLLAGPHSQFLRETIINLTCCL